MSFTEEDFLKISDLAYLADTGKKLKAGEKRPVENYIYELDNKTLVKVLKTVDNQKNGMQAMAVSILNK